LDCSVIEEEEGLSFNCPKVFTTSTNLRKILVI